MNSTGREVLFLDYDDTSVGVGILSPKEIEGAYEIGKGRGIETTEVDSLSMVFQLSERLVEGSRYTQGFSMF